MIPAISAAFSWSGNPAGAAFFLEEALNEWRSSGSLDPLLVDCQAKGKESLLMQTAAGKDLPLKALRLIGGSGLPYCRVEGLQGAWEEAAKKKQSPYLGAKSMIFLPDAGQAARAMELSDELLFLCPAEKESVSALYNAAVSLNGFKNRTLGITVVVSDTPRIEDASEFFLSMREELSKLSLLNAEIRFAGHFNVQADKLLIASSAGRRYRELFAGDMMYGMLKSIGRRWLPSLVAPDRGCSAQELAQRAGTLFARS
jgi:hypothetical protein